MPYVYSTATGSTDFAIFKTSRKDLDVIERVITINGGANLPHPKSLVTSEGVVTRVSDEDLKILEGNYHFQAMVKEGFLKVSKASNAVDKAVKDMSKRDLSAPHTPNDPAFMPRARIGEEPMHDNNHF